MAKSKNLLMDHPFRTQMITLLALVTMPRVLSFKSRYGSDKEPPQQFQPKVDEYGSIFYEVPFEYAERLIRGEPNKYKLISPRYLKMFVNNPKTGGRVLTTIGAVKPVMIGEEPQRDRNGQVVYEKVDLEDMMAS